MTTTVTKEQLATLSTDSTNAQAVSETTKYTGEFEGKFIGTLVGNATTAKELEKPYNFSLSGDASGTVSVNASSVILPVTVNHSTHADTSDFAGKTQLSARASVADMANTAEFAYRAGKFASILINLTGLITGSGTATNSNTVDIEVTDINANGLFVIGKLPTDKADTSKVYVDLEGDNFWIYDLENKEWVNAYSTLLKELEKHNVRITALEKGLSEHSNHLDTIDSEIDALQTLTTTHTADINTLQNRATALEETSGEHTTQISFLENRVGNIETSTDVGQFATRLQAIDEKNAEQDTAIADEVKARTDADSVLETKNTEQDTRLDAIETKNTEQDTALTNAKTELSKAIADNKTATDESISNLTTSLANDYVTLGTEQTITKQKTFSVKDVEPLAIQDSRIEVGVAPNADKSTAILFEDKNKTITSYIQSLQTTNKVHNIRLTARNYKEDGTQVNGRIGVTTDSLGNVNTYAPTPKITSNDTNIANTAWVRQLTENTEQTITKVKSFNQGIRFINAESDIYTDDFSTNKVVSLIGHDKNGVTTNYINFFQNMKTSDTDAKRITSSSLGVIMHPDKNTSTGRSIYIKGKIDNDNNVTFTGHCPTPALKSNSDEIATASYCRSLLRQILPQWSGQISVPLNKIYTVPADGWVLFKETVFYSTMTGYWNNTGIFSQLGGTGAWEDHNSLFFPVRKSDTIQLNSNNGGQCIFFYCLVSSLK